MLQTLEKPMSAYVLIKIHADNPELLKPYQQVAPDIIKKYGGRFLARGGEVVSLEGKAENRRVVLIEFADLETAKAFYHSKEYTHAVSLREGVAEAEIIALEGLNP